MAERLSLSLSFKSCTVLCNLMNCSMPGFLVHHYLPEFAQTHFHSVSDAIQLSNYLILCHSLLFLPSIFPSIRVSSNESVLGIRWPKYWSFSFSISPSKEYSGLTSFRSNWFDLLAVQGTLKSLLQHHSLKAPSLQCSAFFMVQLEHLRLLKSPCPTFSLGSQNSLTQRRKVSCPGPRGPR